MRTLRLTLLGTVIVVLLGGMGVAAQSDEATPDRDFAAWVAGTMRGINYVDYGQSSWVDEDLGEAENRGIVMEGVIEAGDPRVSGSMTTTTNYDSHSLGPDLWAVLTMWGTQRIENEGGAWECSWYGGDMAPGQGEYLSYCTGLDGYEGWAMQLLMTSTENLLVNDFTGLLWPGNVPPLAEPPTAQ